MDSVALVGRLLISLAFVLGVMWLIARRVRKNSTGGRAKARNSSKLIDVLGRQQLTKSSSVAVVRVLEQALIIGVTDGHVSVLGELELAAVEAHLETGIAAKAVRAVKASSAAKAATVKAASVARPRPKPAPTPTANPPAANPAAAKQADPARKPALSGSALSPATWRQTVDSIRDLTVRTR